MVGCWWLRRPERFPPADNGGARKLVGEHMKSTPSFSTRFAKVLAWGGGVWSILAPLDQLLHGKMSMTLAKFVHLSCSASNTMNTGNA